MKQEIPQELLDDVGNAIFRSKEAKQIRAKRDAGLMTAEQFSDAMTGLLMTAATPHILKRLKEIGDG